MRTAKQFLDDAIKNNNGNALTEKQIIDVMLFFARCHVGTCRSLIFDKAEILIHNSKTNEEFRAKEWVFSDEIVTVSHESILLVYSDKDFR